MSDHADTIRYAFFNMKLVDVAAADRALDALLAENQRLREALERIAELDEHGVSFIAREALAGDAE